MEYTKLLYEKENGVMKVTFNNPEKLNALTNEFLEEFNCLLNEIEEDADLQVIILTGAGKAFIAGADISLMSTMTPEEAARYSFNTTEIYRRMEGMNKVFIAAINGFALGGGCEMTLACDLRIASQKAKMGLPEVGLGIFPGGGGTQRLPRLIGMAKAKELVYTAKTIRAEEAEKIGLVNYVVEPEELEAKAMELAEQILKNSKSGVRLSKEAFNNGNQMDIISAMNLEKNLFALCFATEDQKEGMSAFMEKRPANFK
ncbi:MAG: enoyl-CoA hydratase-related protein [Anaerovoracaceae bacterium]